jgi:hypothetical protein
MPSHVAPPSRTCTSGITRVLDCHGKASSADALWPQAPHASSLVVQMAMRRLPRAWSHLGGQAVQGADACVVRAKVADRCMVLLYLLLRLLHVMVMYQRTKIARQAAVLLRLVRLQLRLLMGLQHMCGV